MQNLCDRYAYYSALQRIRKQSIFAYVYAMRARIPVRHAFIVCMRCCFIASTAHSEQQTGKQTSCERFTLMCGDRYITYVQMTD